MSNHTPSRDLPIELAGIVAPIAIGYLVGASGSFNGALVFVGLNALVTVFSYLVIVKDIKRVELRHRDA